MIEVLVILGLISLAGIIGYLIGLLIEEWERDMRWRKKYGRSHKRA